MSIEHQVSTTHSDASFIVVLLQQSADYQANIHARQSDDTQYTTRHIHDVYQSFTCGTRHNIYNETFTMK